MHIQNAHPPDLPATFFPAADGKKMDAKNGKRTCFDLIRFEDALLGIGAAAYFFGFLAAIEIALSKLAY